MRRRLRTVAAIAALTVTLGPPAPAAAADPPAFAGIEPAGVEAAVADGQVAPPVWGDCPPPAEGIVRDPRQRCATLRLPLDYRRPGGRTIDVAISRIPTAKPDLRRGILLFNPGGPGGEGMDFPSLLLPLLPVSVLDRYDLIGFDPRGVGHSTPVTCDIPADTPLDLIIPFPDQDGSIDRNVAFARRMADQCAARSGDLLPFITTANTARDMDRIRAALGERKLSYVGYSYGSYLGAVYTTLFPHRSDRIILDSAVDPNLVWYNQWRTFSIGFASRLPDFTAWAAARDATYHLGSTPAAVERTYYEIAARLDENPVTLDGFVVNGNVFRIITFSALYDDANIPFLAELWQFLDEASTPAPALRQVLGRPASAQVPADNQRAAQWAVVCDDAEWPRDVRTYRRNVAIDRRLFPGTAGFPPNVWPCAFWHYRPVEPPVEVTGRGPRNVLILQNLRDPATPWITGLGLRRALGPRAVMVSVDQGGHLVYPVTNAPCANNLATAFLVTGGLPAHDRFCPGQPLPDATTLGSRPKVVLPGPLG